MDLTKTGLDGADLIHLAQHKNKSWALVNTAMSIQFPQTQCISWLAEEMLASQELYFMELV